MRKFGLLLSVSALALSWGEAALAQNSESIETVTVTAERRNEDLQKAAISATVLTSADLANKSVIKVEDLQFVAPATVVNNFGQGVDFNIRGIGKGSEHNTQTLTGVITYRDAAATFQGYMQGEPYYDIASVEVLRGPQGTFVGQNATGGAVFVTTNNPEIDGGYSGYAQLQYSNYYDIQAQGAINIPISEHFAARFAFFGDMRSSFFSITDSDPADNCPNNKYAGCKPGYNPGDVRWAAGRLSLLYKPNDALTVSLKYDADYLGYGALPGSPFYEGFKTVGNWRGVAAAGLQPGDPNPYYRDIFHVTANSAQHGLDRFTRAILKVDYMFPNGIALRSVSQFANGNTNWTSDLDGTDYGSLLNAALPKNWWFFDRVDETLWTQEINLISPDTGRINWILGLSAQSDIYDFPEDRFIVAVPPNTTKTPTLASERSTFWGKNVTAAYAIFGQVGVHLTNSVEFQLGGRYSIATTSNDGIWDQYGYVTVTTPQFINNNGEEAGRAKFYSLDYKATLNWQLNDNHFLYAFVATGFKPGGLNPPIYTYYQPRPFGEEHVTSYEAGWKSTMFDGHLRTAINAYYNDYKGFIVTTGFPDNTYPGFTTQINNPNSTTSYGLEMESQAVIGNLRFNVGFGLMHMALGEFYAVDARVGGAYLAVCDPKTGPASASCVNLKGHPMTYAPDVTYNFGAEYRFDIGGGDALTPRIHYGHQNPQWASLFDNENLGDRLSARDLVGAQLEWKHDTYLITLYGTNLLDQHYASAIAANSRMPGPPRRYGIRLMKVF